MDVGQQIAALAHQIRFQLHAVGQVAPQTRFGNLAELIDHLRHVLPGIGPFGVIERKAADELGLEGVGHLAGFLHFLFQVFLERHETVLRAVFGVDELHFPQRRTDRGHVQTILVLQVANRLDFALAQVHHVLHAVARVDEPQAVVLQAERGQHRELLNGGFLIGRFVAKRAQRDLRILRHDHHPRD